MLQAVYANTDTTNLSQPLLTLGSIDTITFLGNKVKLDDYRFLKPMKYSKSKFLHYAIIKLSDIDLHDTSITNIGVRDEQNTQDRVNSQTLSYQSHGWQTSDCPPAISYRKDGTIKVIDGRGRILSCSSLQINADYIIVAVYEQEEDITNYDDRKNALVSNNKHKHSEKSGEKDFVSFGWLAYCDGILKVTKTDETKDLATISDFLKREAEIDDALPQAGGSQGRVAKTILTMIMNGGKVPDLLVVKDREGRAGWKALLAKWGMPIIENERVLHSVDKSEKTVYLWSRQIWDAMTLNRGSKVEIIFYISGEIRTPSSARREMKKAKANLEAQWDKQVEAFGVKMDCPFVIIGAVPQVVGDHDSYFEQKSLVSIDNY